MKFGEILKPASSAADAKNKKQKKRKNQGVSAKASEKKRAR